jgi:hypothetical protein
MITITKLKFWTGGQEPRGDDGFGVSTFRRDSREAKKGEIYEMVK